MSTLIIVLLPLVIVLTIFLVVYRSVPGKKSSKLKRISWLEILIAYFCVLAPTGLFMGFGKISRVFEKVPDLKPLSYIDLLLRLILILISLYVGVCLWKTAKGAVKKAKIMLIALLVFNIVVVKGIYNFAIYATLASAGLSIPAKVLLDAIIGDAIGSIAYAAVIVFWYIYLNRSQRVREIYGTPSVTQTIPHETNPKQGAGIRSSDEDGTSALRTLGRKRERIS